MMMLEQSTRDFQSLIDRMQVQKAFENAKDGNRWDTLGQTLNILLFAELDQIRG